MFPSPSEKHLDKGEASLIRLANAPITLMLSVGTPVANSVCIFVSSFSFQKLVGSEQWEKSETKMLKKWVRKEQITEGLWLVACDWHVDQCTCLMMQLLLSNSIHDWWGCLSSFQLKGKLKKVYYTFITMIKYMICLYFHQLWFCSYFIIKSKFHLSLHFYLSELKTE